MRHEVHHWEGPLGSLPVVYLFDGARFVTYVRADEVMACDIDLRPPALGKKAKRWLTGPRGAVCRSYLLSLAWDEMT